MAERSRPAFRRSSNSGSAAAMADDLEQGFIDRLRSLPISRASVSRHFVTRALIWALAILAISLPIAVAKYQRG
jgi:hypothetical protein